MTFQTKARPLLAALLPTILLATVTAPAVAAEPVSTFMAYTAPLAQPLGETAPHVPLIAASALIAVSALAMFLPFRKPAAPAPAAPATPAPAEAVGPIYCPRSRRWRDAKTGRLVKAPRV